MYFRLALSSFFLFLCCCAGLSNYTYAQTSQPLEPAQLAGTAQLTKQLESVLLHAQTLRQQGNPQQALAVALELNNSLPESRSLATRRAVNKQIAEAYMALNDYPNALGFLSQNLSLAEQLGEQTAVASAYHDLGRLYRYQQRYGEALDMSYKALAIYQSVEDVTHIGEQYNQIGVVLEHMGQLQESLQAHKQSLAINRQRNDLSGIATGLYNVGEIHKDLGDLPEALSYFQDALKIDQQTGNRKDIAYSNLKVGSVLVLMDRAQQAKPYIQTAYDIFVDIEAPRDQDWARRALAEAELSLDNLDSAEMMLNDVLVRSQARKSLSLLVDIYHNLAKIQLAKQNYTGALAFIAKGISQAKQNNEQRDVVALEGLNVTAYELAGDTQQALAALKRQKALEAQLLNKKRIAALAQLQSQTAFLQKEQEIALLKKDRKLQQLQRQKDRERLTLVSTLLVVFLVLAFVLQSRLTQRRLNQKLSREVAAQTRELTIKHLELTDAYQAVEQASLTDPLTGLHNRRFLEQNLDYDLLRSHRAYGDWLTGTAAKPIEKDLVFFLIDIDDFKSVNDTYGHSAGDAVLIEMRELLAKVFRQSDFIVRWGGEEFMVVSRFINRETGFQLAERLLTTVAQHVFQLPSGKVLQKTCSIGFAAFPFIPEQPVCLTWRCITNVADYCLYAAKSSGRNAVIGLEGPLAGLNPKISDDLLSNIKSLIDAEQLTIKTTLPHPNDISWPTPKPE